jgi:hypothetical protein
VSVEAPGILASDAITWSFAGAPTPADALMAVQTFVTANSVNFLRCNPTAVPQAGTAMVINWQVVR